MFAVLRHVWKTWNVFNSHNFHLLSSRDGLGGCNQSAPHLMLWAEHSSDKEQETEGKLWAEKERTHTLRQAFTHRSVVRSAV